MIGALIKREILRCVQQAQPYLPTSITELAVVDSVNGSTARIKRQGQTATIPVPIRSGLTVVANDVVYVERRHGSLLWASIVDKA